MQLTVRDGGGQQGSATLTVEIRPLGPEASFRILLDGNDSVQYNWTAGGWRNITLTVTDEMDESSDAMQQLRVIPQDYGVDYSDGQALIISNTEDEEQFPVDVFLEAIDLNLRVESNSGSFSYTIYVLDSDGKELWSDEGSLNGGDDASHAVALDSNATGGVIGTDCSANNCYVIRIEIEREGLSPASASWDFQGWVRYT